jgi:hypothetical protein
MAGVVVPIDGDISPILGQFAKLPDRTQAEMDAVGRIVADEMRKGRIAKAFGEMPGVAEKNAKKAANMIAREMDRAAKETERAMAESARATEQALAAEARAAARAAKDIEASMERAARESADAMEAAAKESQRSMGDMKRGLSPIFGGLVNDIDDIAGALVAMGPAGFAAAAALAAAGAAAVGFVAAGALVTFLYEAAEGSGKLEDEQRALKAVMKSLSDQVGTKFAPTFEMALTAMVAFGLGLTRVVDVIFQQMDALVEWYDGLGLVGQAIVDSQSMMFRLLSTNEQLRDGTLDTAGAFGGLYDEAALLIGNLQMVADEEDKAKVATDKYNAALAESKVRAREAATELKRLAEIRANFVLAGEKDEIDTLAMLDAQMEKTLGTMPETMDRSAKAAANMQNTYLGAASDIGGAIGDLSGLLLEQGGISEEAAQALIVVQKAAGIAQIGISTAVAVMNAFRDLPTPAAPFAAAGIIALGVAQAAVVAATPTTFHTGGMVRAPDEVGITARNGEGVLTAQGVDAIGGQAGLNRANRGEGGGGSITVVQQYQHRVFDAFVADNVRSDGPLRKAIRGKRRIGHAGRR